MRPVRVAPRLDDRARRDRGVRGDRPTAPDRGLSGSGVEGERRQRAADDRARAEQLR